MSVPRKRNPYRESTARTTFSAIGLGLGVASAGLAVGHLYRKPSVAISAVVLGVGLACWHLPWSKIGEPSEP